ncbi:polysaccharide deacetylase family protein [Pseudoalteromonas sp. NFXS39]|uniref:polysaccharide deacetylase family protein n=1 Tax=Pseudoalteromonas sp. NFXS39 TaxID=2818437 RepID=UPI0032DF2C9A
MYNLKLKSLILLIVTTSFIGCGDTESQSVNSIKHNLLSKDISNLTTTELQNLGFNCVSENTVSFTKSYLSDINLNNPKSLIINEVCKAVFFYELDSNSPINETLLLKVGLSNIYKPNGSVDAWAIDKVKEMIIGKGTDIRDVKYELEQFMLKRERVWPKQISITFDDGIVVDSILEHLSIFDKYGARFTYFVSHFEQYDRRKFHILQGYGVEIGHHGALHVNAVDYISKYGIQQWEQNELLGQLNSMKVEGFYPEAFAYPYGAFSNESDEVLSKHFKFIRKFDSRPNIKYRIVSGAHSIVTSYSIDDHRIDLKQIKSMIDELQGGDTLFISSHAIGEWFNEFHISKEHLEAILNYGTSKGILFCSFSDCIKQSEKLR